MYDAYLIITALLMCFSTYLFIEDPEPVPWRRMLEAYGCCAAWPIWLLLALIVLAFLAFVYLIRTVEGSQ